MALPMNCNNLKIYLILMLLMSFGGYSFAQNKNDANEEATTGNKIILDSVNSGYASQLDTALYKNEFEEANDSILKWKQMREFGYMAYIDSLLRKRKNLTIDTVNINGNGKSKKAASATAKNNSGINNLINSLPVKIFFWLVAIFFIGFVLYKLFFTGGLFVKGNTSAAPEPADEKAEPLNGYSAYNLLINEAEAKNDFNLAIRYLYLQSLKKLADNDLIIFSPEKTNNLYVQEMSSHDYQSEFAFLTRQYEFTWYGKFKVDNIWFEQLKNRFILFNKNI
ncbi:MAG: hypothetical protein ABI358_01980 [Ginsengibacter sp.]